MVNKKPCVVCGVGELERGVRVEAFRYKGSEQEFEQPGWYCNHCDDGILEPSDLKATRIVRAEIKAKLDRRLSPSEVKGIRESLGLTQEQASVLLGGGLKAFARYENGDVLVSRAMSNLLRLLRDHPALLKSLDDEAA